MEFQRMLLDELMGPDRNASSDQKKHFSDPDVCKDFLVEVCPNELFVNTKSDIGACTLLHDNKLKTDYQNERDKDLKYPYKQNFYQHVKNLIRDLDKRVQRNKSRLENKGDADLERLLETSMQERREKMILLEEQIKSYQQRIEQCGEEGLVDEAAQLNTDVEAMLVSLHALKTEEVREKRMEICQVCGALLTLIDSPERVRAHNEGKQHQGYIQLRDIYERYHAQFEAEKRGTGQKEEPEEETREHKIPESRERSESRQRNEPRQRNGSRERREDYRERRDSRERRDPRERREEPRYRRDSRERRNTYPRERDDRRERNYYDNERDQRSDKYQRDYQSSRHRKRERDFSPPHHRNRY